MCVAGHERRGLMLTEEDRINYQADTLKY